MPPDFLIIGAPRCGTTYLAKNLANHPDIFIAFGEEEYAAGDLHYFDTSTPEGKANHPKGKNWYLSHFANARNDQLTGEKTADYLTDPNAAKLIHDEIGPVKILLLIRDPIQRAWSHFCHSRHRLPLSIKFSDLLNNPAPNGVDILTSGKYFELLQPYIELFGENNIHLVVQDDLTQNPEKTLAEVCNFLGINTSHVFSQAHARINAGSSNWKAHLSARIGRWLKEKLPSTYNFLLNGPFSDRIKTLVKQLRGKSNERQDSITESSLPIESIPALQKYYQSDVTKLSEYINKDLTSLWWDVTNDAKTSP